MLDQAFERFPGEVEAVEGRIAALQRGHDAQGLRIVIEAAEGRETLVERALAGMTERRMAEIVGQRQRLGEIFVEAERARQRARHLRHFERMGEPGAVMVALVEHENLGLVLEAAEGGRMDDAVAVAAEGAAALADRLGVQPAAALPRIARIRRADMCHPSPSIRPAAWQLTLSTGALNYRVDAVAIGCDSRPEIMTMEANLDGSQRHRDRTGGAQDRRNPAAGAGRHHAARQRRGRRLLGLPVQIRHRARAAPTTTSSSRRAAPRC